jgi:2-polyprenyl-3-methyl-5-hydroxy-6-metoxy-1,4-benzoquinol methylase
MGSALNPKSALQIPRIYQLFQSVVGASRSRAVLANEHLCAPRGGKVLDIGCGTGEIIEYLSDVSYTGFDPNPAYVDHAIAKYGTKGDFRVGSISNPPDLSGPYDLVMALGVLHHLDNEDALEMLGLAAQEIRPGSPVVTVDPVISNDQSRLAGFVVRQDRGRFVRHVKEYESLARTVFPTVSARVRHDLLNIPYSHIVMRCELGVPGF